MLQLLLAAGDSAEPTNVEWMPALTTLVVFIIFFAILRIKVWPPIVKGLEDRQNKIREEIESAEDARKQANDALKEYEDSLAEARKEAADMIAKARADAKAAADELRSRNESELADMKERAARDITAAKRQAIAELHAESATLAASIAGKILQREISSDDQQRLVEESLRELAGAAEN